MNSPRITTGNPYAGKKTLVLGLGRSGIAAARLLQRCGAQVTVCDTGESQALLERAQVLQTEGATVFTGAGVADAPHHYDLAVLSPGIEETADLVTRVTAGGTPLIGELELAFTLCECPVVAITGSNGKTTTTELTARMLRGAGMKTVACGNIGTPMSECVRSAEDWDVLVAEVSSFQLETTVTFRPKAAAWLNLSPNHLDRYPSMDAYREAKLRIFRNQAEEDTAVVPYGADLPRPSTRTITFSSTDPEADLTLRGSEILYHGRQILNLDETSLRGPHNARNLMAAFGCGIALGADPAAMASAVADYTPPPHRCEFLGEREGIRWINDSKATNLDAMEQAIRSVEGPLVLIAGGKDKGFEFAPIAPLVRERVGDAVLIGEMRHRIARDWSPVPAHCVESLGEAVEIARRKAGRGGTVLFSPGTSSFDMFRDYVDRGETFRRLVEALPAPPYSKQASL